VLVVILFLVGCDPFKPPTEPLIERNIYTGTTGVTVDIYKLPEEVYENEIFNYAAKIENKGPYKVNNAKLIVTIDKGYMKFKEGNNYLAIDGINLDEKNFFNMFNDFTVSNTPIYVQEIDSFSEYHDAVILSSFCYDYKGIANADICIDTDPHEVTAAEKYCENPDSISLSEGQGGPVVIDTIEPRMLIDSYNGREIIRPQFKISVMNKGEGTVFKPGFAGQVCSEQSFDDSVYNSISLDNIKISNKFDINNFECLPPNLVLREGQESIICTLKPESGIEKGSPAYNAVLIVEISYGYMTTSSENIKIKKILPY
jgi:hypothetical protein